MALPFLLLAFILSFREFCYRLLAGSLFCCFAGRRRATRRSRWAAVGKGQAAVSALAASRSASVSAMSGVNG